MEVDAAELAAGANTAEMGNDKRAAPLQKQPF